MRALRKLLSGEDPLLKRSAAEADGTGLCPTGSGVWSDSLVGLSALVPTEDHLSSCSTGEVVDRDEKRKGLRA